MKPPNSGAWCFHARDWIDVKYTYDMSVDSAEKSALESMLGTC